jgi:pyridoxine kinase
MGGDTVQPVLTIQSSVAYGHVGNSAAAFALQRLGRDVIRIDTVRFSNHPAHGGFSGEPASASEIDALISGLSARGFLAEISAILSGYLGTFENTQAVRRAVLEAKKSNPGSIYCLDPVIGDHPKGQFVAKDIPKAIASDLLPLADIITPNAFELEVLSGLTVQSPSDAIKAARVLLQQSQLQIVVTTGLHLQNEVITVATTPEQAWQVCTPRIDAPAFGAGDLFCALFLARHLEKISLDRALSLAASGVFAVFRETALSGSLELALIKAQDALANPPEVFPAQIL